MMEKRSDRSKPKARPLQDKSQKATQISDTDKATRIKKVGMDEGLSRMLRAVRATRKLQRHAPALQPVPRDQKLPLSFQQQRLWFFSQLEPGSPAQNSIRAYRITGSLKRDALLQGLDEIIRRHEVLRTTFCVTDNHIRAVIAPALPLRLELSDLQQVPEDKREAAALQFAREQAVQPIDLVNGPIFRVALIRLDAQTHILLLFSHDIIFDHRSWEVFDEELSVLYAAFSQQQPSPLEQPELQYADFAHWQRHWLREEVLETLRAYWKGQLGRTYTPVALPTDHPRPIDQSFNRGEHPWTLPKAPTDALKALSQAQGVTLYATLLAGLNTLLYRHTGHQDVLIFSPTSGRKRFEVQRLIGPVSNILCLRSDLCGEPSYSELLHRTRDVVLEGFAHQDLPFEQILQTLKLAADSSQSELYQIRFIFLSTPVSRLELSGLGIERLEVDNATTKFDLELFIEDIEGELRGSLTYNKKLFESSTIKLMLDHLQTILQAMASDPEQSISALPLQGLERSPKDLESTPIALLKDSDQGLGAAGGIKKDPFFLRKPGSQDFIEHMLRQIWTDILGVTEIGTDDDFFEIGGSSLGAMRMLVQIEESFGKSLPVSAFAEQPTISALARRINEDCPWSEQSDLVAVQPHGQRPPFFFVFGDAAYLSRYLDPEQPFYWFTRWPKRLRLAKKATPLPDLSIEEIAADYVEQLRQVQAQGPYYLGGSCAGGILCFEMARQLRQQGEQVALLALFDLPNLKRRVEAMPMSAKIERELRNMQTLEGLQKKLWYVLRSTARTIVNQPLFTRNVGAMAAKIAVRYYLLTGRGMPLELTRRYTHGKIVEALSSYRYQPYDGPVDLFFSELWIGPADKEFQIPQDSVWYKTLKGPVTIHRIPGATHHEIFHEPHIQLFANQLNHCLDRQRQPSRRQAMA